MGVLAALGAVTAGADVRESGTGRAPNGAVPVPVPLIVGFSGIGAREFPVIGCAFWSGVFVRCDAEEFESYCC